MFNEREKLILQVLLKNNEQLSIKEIAKATKIKERTLYREIKNLESSLQALDIDLIKEKSKYYLSGNIESLDSAQFETSFEDYAYSAETRLNLILCFIILNEDTSIKDISEKLMLSYNTVASIVPTIEKILEDYKLSLVRKKGQGIEIVGKEIDRRILLISLLCNEISDEEFFTRLNGRESLSSNPFMKFLNFDLLTQIFYNNKNLEIFNVYTDSSIKKILISLNIVFLRLSYETESKEKYTQDEYRYIIDLLEATKKSVEFDITDSIINFLIKILKTCRLIEQLSYFNDKYSYTLVYKINLLIKYVSEKMNVDFTQDTNLSGGQRQRVATARALIDDSKLIIADEPTGALDSANSEKLMALLQEINKSFGITILLVTHDPAAAKYSSRMVLLSDGKIMDDLERNSLSNEQYLQEIYSRTR